MKITVRIDDEWFEVEVGDLYARPVIAAIDGEYFEVWPELGPSVSPKPSPHEIREAGTSRPQEPEKPAAARPAAPARAGDTRAVHAPIPGVIVSIAVETGTVVEVGQELCVLEAMKMKNTIRATRAGTIERIAVAVGDHVRHHDLLFEYAS